MVLKVLPLRDWMKWRTHILVIGHPTHGHDMTPFLRRWDEHVKTKKTPKRRLDKSNSSKEKTALPLHGACLSEQPRPHSQNPCSADAFWTCHESKTHSEGPEGPYGESSAPCAQWNEGGELVGPSQLPPPCIAHFGRTNLIAQTAASGPPISAGAGSLGHISSPLCLLKPSVICTPVPGPRSYLPGPIFFVAIGVLQLFFPVGFCAIYALTLLSSGHG